MRRPSIGWARLEWRAAREPSGGFPQCRCRTDLPGQAGSGEPKRHSRLLAWKAFTLDTKPDRDRNRQPERVLPGDLPGGCCGRSHAASHRDAKNGAFRTLLREDDDGAPGGTPPVVARIKAIADSPRLRVRRIAVRHGMGRSNINSGRDVRAGSRTPVSAIKRCARRPCEGRST